MDYDDPEYIGWYNDNADNHQATGVLNTGQLRKTLRIASSCNLIEDLASPAMPLLL